MLQRTALGAGWLVAAAAIALAGSPDGQVTVSGGQRGAGASSVPRTPWGQPDLQGVWTNSTTTPLERPADLADKAVLTDEERRLRDAKVASQVSFDRAGALPGVGAYNEFWMERGALNHRTSLVIDPPDGKIPAMTAAGQARASALAADRKAHRDESFETLTAYDRCISRSLPGAMMPGFYNHNYQIVQTRDYVVIVVEMIHDARIVPLDGRPHANAAIRSWLGDSIGRWEGDTLVVFSDGVTDAMDSAGQEFGEERLLVCLDQHQACKPAELLDRILRVVRAFAASAVQTTPWLSMSMPRGSKPGSGTLKIWVMQVAGGLLPRCSRMR